MRTAQCPLMHAVGVVQARSAGLEGEARYRDRMASTSKIEAFLAEPRNIVVAGIRRDGSPHLSPNWFYWDGERFYVSTTRHRAKYTIFGRDSRAQLLVDDCTGHRAVLARGTVEVREDIAAELPRFRAIREKHGVAVPGDQVQLRGLIQE